MGEKCMTNLDKLEELTAKLPEFDEIVGFCDKSLIELHSSDDSDGEVPISLGFGLYRDRRIGIMQFYMPKNSIIRTHKHSDSIEWLGVIVGRVKIIYDNDEKTYELLAGDAEKFLPGIPHRIVALDNSWLWGISIPPARGYLNNDNV